MGYRNGTYLYKEITPRAGADYYYTTEQTATRPVLNVTASGGSRAGAGAGATGSVRPKPALNVRASGSGGGGSSSGGGSSGGGSSSGGRSSGSGSSGAGAKASASGSVGFEPSTQRFYTTDNSGKKTYGPVTRQTPTGRVAITGPATPAATLANTKFGSFNIADLQKQPPISQSNAIRAAAIAKQYEPLKLLQTVKGQDLFNKGKALERIAENYRNTKDPRLQESIRNQMLDQSKLVLEAYDSWVMANAGMATAKGVPISDDRVKALLNLGVKGGPGVPGALPVTVDQLTNVFNKGGSWATMFTAAGNVASDAIIGCAAGKCPSTQEMGNSIYSNSVGAAHALSMSSGGAFPGVGGLSEIPKHAGTAAKIAGRMAGTLGGSITDLPVTLGFALSKIFLASEIADKTVEA